MALLWCVKSARFRFNFPFNLYWNLNKRFFYQAYKSLPSCEHLWNNDETNLSKEKIEFFISHVFDNTQKIDKRNKCHLNIREKNQCIQKFSY